MLIDFEVKPSEFNGHEYLRICSKIDICIFLPDKRVKIRNVKALWDTGATNTCIPMELAENMGIPLRENTNMRLGTVDQASRFCSFYLRFKDKYFIFIRDGVAVPGSRNQLVIGMDVMKCGKTLIVPNGQNGVKFTFEISDNKLLK